jgi:hypothetical protein
LNFVSAKATVQQKEEIVNLYRVEAEALLGDGFMLPDSLV